MKHAALPFLLSSIGLLATASGVHAASRDAVDRCIELAPAHQIVRSGGSQHFLIKSGEDHYKVAFQHSCGSLSTASRIAIRAEGREGSLCPGTSVLETPRETCAVGEVTRIAPEDFSRQQRRRR